MESPSQAAGAPRRRFKKRWIALALPSLLIAGIGYGCSPRRDLELALDVECLSDSLHHEVIVVDAWTDYSVRASFEIAPADLQRLLEARPYQRTEAQWRSLPAPNSALGNWEPA